MIIRKQPTEQNGNHDSLLIEIHTKMNKLNVGGGVAPHPIYISYNGERSEEASRHHRPSSRQ